MDPNGPQMDPNGPQWTPMDPNGPNELHWTLNLRTSLLCLRTRPTNRNANSDPISFTLTRLTIYRALTLILLLILLLILTLILTFDPNRLRGPNPDSQPDL